MMHLSAISDKVLPQPASFSKKKQYEVRDVLGTGTFGKVMVRLFISLRVFQISRIGRSVDRSQ